MWQQAGSASGFKNYVACELPQLLGTISDSTSVMQSLFSISLQVLQFCLADSSCVLQQWGTQFLLTFPSCYNTEQLSVFLQSMNAQHTYINRYCMYENLHLCIFLELESALWFHYPDFYIIHCLIPNVSICIHLHTNTCVSNIMQSKPLFFVEAFGSSLRVVETSPRWAVLSWKRLEEGNLRFHPAGWGQILYCWCAPTNHGLHGRILAILGLMTVTAFYFDAYVVLKCLNA